MGFFHLLFSSDFMPHGFCYLWNPRVLWLNVVSDGLIALSYYCIPLILIYFIRKNRDLPVNRIFWMFGAFILACGTTHAMEVWNVWHGSYPLAGVIKAITAAVSVLTVVMLVPLVPKVMSLPERMYLQGLNRKLEREIADRQRFDAPIDAPLQRRVTAGFVIAVLVTIFIGFSSWRGAQLAAWDEVWVAHTYNVMDRIGLLSKHLIEVETSARAFALSGQYPLLTRLENARASIPQDQHTLRRLTADNSSLQRDLDVLEPQLSAAIEFAQQIIAKRKVHAFPGGPEALEIERLTDAVRATTGEMRDEEERLLEVRLKRASAHRQLTRLISFAGIFVGVCLWGLARLAVNHEIGISARARGQLAALNAELEQRVEQRTAALQSEIADRRRAQETTERLAAVVESSDDAIITKTLQGIITAWNGGAEKLFGYTSAEMLGKPMRMVIPPERQSEETDILARISRGESVEHFETVRIRKDGGMINVSVTISPIRDSAGVIVGASKIARDITERKRAEEVLREKEHLLSESQRIAHVGSWTCDPWDHTVPIIWSDESYRIFGVSPARFTPTIESLLNLIVPGDRAAMKKWIAACAAGEQPGNLEFCVTLPDGTVRTISSRGELQLDAENRALQIAGTSQDITERKQVEAALAGQAEELSRQAEELMRSRQALETQALMLRSVLDSMSEGLVVADEQGKFIVWNPAAKKIVGLGPADIGSDEWTAHYGVFLPDTVTPFPTEQNPLLRAIQGEICTAEMFLRNAQLAQGAWIEASAGPLRDQSGNIRGGVVAFRDITQKKADDREIRKLNDELEIRVMERTAQLEVANKELEAFSYSVSHDLRAPLRHIGGFSKMLVEEFGATLDPGAQHYLERIQAGTQKMGQLVDELLNLARVGRHAINRQPTRLNPIVEEVVAMLEPESEGRQVRWEIGDLPLTECDPILVKQIFQNLITNALKFTRTRTPAVIEITHKKEEGQTVFVIRDNGIGFNMKYVDKLFGVFQRLHRPEDFEGTGIGLATVQRIVQKHGGQVRAEGEVDKGAVFYFTLGVAKQADSKTNEATAGGQS
jgi:PAS domain S-box-containing protein